MIDQSATHEFLDQYLFPKKLKEYNFDEASLDWIQSYLGERKQCVRMESKNFLIVKKVDSPKDQYWLNIPHH